MTIITVSNIINECMRSKVKNNKHQYDKNNAEAIIKQEVYDKLDTILDRDKYINNYVGDYIHKMICKIV